MSFPRAKINRFNEVAGCAPPPGTYQPKWEEKPILGTMARNPRFLQRRSLDGEIDTSRILSTPVCEQKVRHKSFSVLKRRPLHKNGSVDREKKLVKERASQAQKSNDHVHCACVTRGKLSLKKMLSQVKEIAGKCDRNLERFNSILLNLEECGTNISRFKEEFVLYVKAYQEMKAAHTEMEDRTETLKDLNVDYQIKIAKLQDKIDCLMTEKNELSMEVNSSRSKVAEMEDSIQCLKQESAEMERDSAALLKEKESIEKHMELMQEVLIEHASTINKLHSQVDLADDKILSMEKQKLEVEVSLALAEEAKREVEIRFASEKVDIYNHQKALIVQIQEKLDLKCAEVMSCKEEILNLEKRLCDANTIQIKEREFFDMEVSNLEKIWREKFKFVEKQLEMETKNVSEVKFKLVETLGKLKSVEEAKENAEMELTDWQNLLIDKQKTHENLIQEGSKKIEDLKEKIILVLKTAGVEVQAEVEDCSVLVDTIATALRTSRDNSELIQLRRDIVEKDLAIQNLKRVIGPFREQLELYEQERLALKNLTQQTRGEMEKLALQQAAALGHQNHKQKIRYLVKLKEHNLKITEENNVLRAKLRQKERVIAKYAKHAKQVMPATPSALDVMTSSSS